MGSEIAVAATYWVAYSGGVDSHVLLHTLVCLRQYCSFELRAVHIHHGLNPKANEWQQHCEAVCRDLNVKLTVHALNMSPAQDNIEARARELRYAYFSSLLQPHDCLLTGHHQDDQAETMLLQLLRGAGPKGMAAMPASSPLGAGLLLRPFLAITRDKLLAYAQEHQLTWIDDDSNQNTRFARNFIRQQVMPLIKQRWPSAVETITRSAKHCAETESLLEDYIKPLAQNCLSPNGLSITNLKQLTYVQQKHVIRYWLSQRISLPNELKLENILHVFLTAHPDKNPEVEWDNAALRRYQDELILTFKLNEHNAQSVYFWDLQAPLKIENLGITLHATVGVGSGIKLLPKQACEIRFRRGDEHVYLAHRQGGRSLKKCFQEWRVPVWQRDRVPLLYVDNKLAAIIGYAVCEGFTVGVSEAGIMIEAGTE